MNWRAGLFLAVLGVLPCRALDAEPYPIVTDERLALTKDYCRAHYGLDSYALVAPRMVVIHDTAIATRESSLAAFKPERLPAWRKEIAGFGDVNVGVHFLVDRDGAVYSLLPLDVIGRHTIGFNHVALGIENVAADESALTDAQVLADATLVAELVRELPSLRYLIGHHEYADAARPHHALYKELVADYKPTRKTDPGPDFMRKLRAELAERNVVLED